MIKENSPKIREITFLSLFPQTGPVRLRVPASRWRPEGGSDLPQRDTVGEEHHAGGAAGVPALLVVVS